MMFSLRSRLSGLTSPEDAEDAEDTQDTDADSWPYEWTETEVEKVHGEPVISHSAEDDPESVFAGPLARKMIEGPRNNPEQPLYVGLGTRKGRHVGIERQYLFRHTAVFGVTGYGKSTLIKNSVKQVIESGHGACFIDPKGQDSVELMQMIPDDRLDDVVWIEPGNSRSAVAGFNFLEVGVDEDDPMYDTAVENVVGDLVRMVGLDDYWGPLMDGVCSNLIRGTTRLDRDFNLLDLYYILISEDARQQYAEMLQQEGLTFLADYAGKIEEMEDDDLDALQRRFKDWVEDPLARSTVAHRDTDIDMESIVEDDKILVVRMAEQDEELKEMIGTAILRRIWSSIRSRAATYDTDYDPFFLFADEFDLLATQDSSVTTMLSKARSLSLALFLCCQQPSQLPQNVVDAMYANCDTVLSFSPGSPKDAKAVAKNLDMDPTTLRHESNYHVWTQLTLSETRERSEAFRTYCLPPFPPIRGEPEAMHAIERTVRDLGREPLSDKEMRRQLILGGDLPDEDLLPDAAELTAERKKNILAAVLDESIHREDTETGGWVPGDAVTIRVREYLSDDFSDAELSNLIDSIPTTGEDAPLQYDDRGKDGDFYRCTASGRALALTSGTNETGGSKKHRALVRDAHAGLSDLGLRVRVPDQDGREMPDAIASPTEILPDTDDMTDKEAARAVLSAGEDHPVIDELTDLEPVHVEPECQSASKPARVLTNLQKAVDSGTRCLFVTRPDYADTVRNIVKNGYKEVDEDGLQVLYNDRSLTVNDEQMYRPDIASRTVWRRDPDTDSVYLEDSNGERHAAFDSIEEAYADTDAYPATESDVDDEEEWRPVTEPVHPEYVFEDGLPDEDKWDVIVAPSLPDSEVAANDLELVVDDDLQVPLTAVGQRTMQTGVIGETDSSDEQEQEQGTDRDYGQSGGYDFDAMRD